MIDSRIMEHLCTVTEEEKAILEGKSEIDRARYMTGTGDVVMAERLMASGKLISVRPHTRFVHFPEHTHDYIELVYMCSGSTTHIVNGNVIRLNEGELLFLSRNARQEILRAEKDDIAVNFIILPAFFTRSISVLGTEKTPLREFIVNSLCADDNGPGYLHFKVSDVLPIQNLMENLLFTLISKTYNKREVHRTTMDLLFLHLLSYTEYLSGDTKQDTLIMRVLRYAEEHYKNGSLSEAAKLLHRDSASLSRQIKQLTGKNFTDIIQDKRLSQAAYLLRNTEMTVADISRAVGYENVSYFYRCFEKRYGCLPSVLRENY